MSEVAFFGKVPFAPDFVRLGVTPPVREFENWVHDGTAELRSAGAKSMPGTCSFLFPTGTQMIAAVAVPSRDRIGRQFLAVVATALETDGTLLSRAVAILACERFCEEGARAIEANSETDRDTLWNAIQAVRPPTPAEISDATQRHTALLDTELARTMEEACFAGPDDRFYGYHTLRLALRDAPPPDPRVLMCPTAGETRYAAFWAEAIERATEGRIALPMLWTGSSLVVGLARAPKSMLRCGAGLGGNSNALWPLSTEYASARERSKAALRGEFWDDQDQKLGGLIESIMRIPL